MWCVADRGHIPLKDANSLLLVVLVLVVVVVVIVLMVVCILAVQMAALRASVSMLTFWVSDKSIYAQILFLKSSKLRVFVHVSFMDATSSTLWVWSHVVLIVGVWFKTAGLNPDGDENNNKNKKVYWIIYTPYVTFLLKLSSTSQFLNFALVNSFCCKN